MQNTFPYLIILFFFLSSCKQPEDNIVNYNFTTDGIFICNEGNFTYGNSSLSFINLSENKIYNNVFYDVNNFPLGDVAQSITFFENFAFVTINNSGKIFIIDKNTFEFKAEITGLTSPREICIIDSEKAYISDLYSSYITIFNPSTFEITGNINLGCSSEQFIYYQNFTYVLSWSFNNKVFKIDTNNQIISNIEVTYQPNSMVVDKNENLWILSDGGNEGDEKQQLPALTKVSISDFVIDTVFQFEDIKNSPSNICINNTKDTICFLNNSWGSNSNSENGIYKMSIEDKNIPKTAFIKQENRNFYRFFVNPITSEIFVSDALSFTEDGIILHYSADGKLIQTFEAGIIPGSFGYKQTSN